MFALLALLAAAQPPSSLPAIDAATVAGAIRPRLPQRFSPDVAMVGAASEGNLLVLTFEVSEAALLGATPDAISSRFSFGFCTAEAGRALLDGPMSLRIDARAPGGRLMQGAVLETCPAQPEARR